MRRAIYSAELHTVLVSAGPGSAHAGRDSDRLAAVLRRWLVAATPPRPVAVRGAPIAACPAAPRLTGETARRVLRRRAALAWKGDPSGARFAAYQQPGAVVDDCPLTASREETAAAHLLFELESIALMSAPAPGPLAEILDHRGTAPLLLAAIGKVARSGGRAPRVAGATGGADHVGLSAVFDAAASAAPHLMLAVGRAADDPRRVTAAIERFCKAFAGSVDPAHVIPALGILDR